MRSRRPSGEERRGGGGGGGGWGGGVGGVGGAGEGGSGRDRVEFGAQGGGGRYRDRFQRERDVQLGLDLAHMRGQDVQRRAAAGQRQQVPGLPATRAHERDVLAHQRRIERRCAGGEMGDPHGVERLRTPQGEPHPVRDRRHPAPP